MITLDTTYPFNDQLDNPQNTYGDEVLDNFFNGMYNDGVEMLLEHNIEPNLLAEYIIDNYSPDGDIANFMTTVKFAHIGMSYQQAHDKRRN